MGILMKAIKAVVTKPKAPRPSESGVVALEFAIIAPILILFLLGVIEFGFYFIKSDVAQRTLSVAAASIQRNANDATIQALAINAGGAMLPFGNNGVYVCAKSYTTLALAQAGLCISGDWTTTAPGGVLTSYYVAIKAYAPNKLITPLGGFWAGALGLTIDHSVVVQVVPNGANNTTGGCKMEVRKGSSNGAFQPPALVGGYTGTFGFFAPNASVCSPLYGNNTPNASFQLTCPSYSDPTCSICVSAGQHVTAPGSGPNCTWPYSGYDCAPYAPPPFSNNYANGYTASAPVTCSTPSQPVTSNTISCPGTTFLDIRSLSSFGAGCAGMIAGGPGTDSWVTAIPPGPLCPSSLASSGFSCHFVADPAGGNGGLSESQLVHDVSNGLSASPSAYYCLCGLPQ